MQVVCEQSGNASTDLNQLRASKEKEVAQLESKLEDAQDKLQKQTAQVEALRADRDKAQEKGRSLQTQLETTGARSSASEGELACAAKEIVSLTKTIADHEQKIATIQGTHDQTLRARSSLEDELSALKAKEKAAAARSSKLSEELDRLRHELSESHQQAKKTQQALEESQTECQALLNNTTQRENRVNAAHALTESRMQSLQEQASSAIEQKAAADARSKELMTEASAARAREEIAVAEKARKEAEHQGSLEGLLAREKELEAEITSLNDKLSMSEETGGCYKAVVVEDRQKLVSAQETAARCEELVKHREKDVQVAEAQAAAANDRASSLENEVAQALSQAQGARDEADSHKQLIRSLQHQLAEQESKYSSDHEVQIDKLQQELLDARRLLALQSSQSTENLQEGIVTDAKGAGSSHGANASNSTALINEVPETRLVISPENAGQEETLALRETIEGLEKRCLKLQNRLDSRPIIYQTARDDGEDPLSLDSGASTAQISLARRVVEKFLRDFTKRLLKKDAWLWVFYIHLLVLYAISGTYMSVASSGQAADDLGLSMTQESAAVAISATVAPSAR